MKVLLKCFWMDNVPGDVVEIIDVQAKAMLENGSAETVAKDAPVTPPADAGTAKK
jgi:hypothetical protein